MSSLFDLPFEDDEPEPQAVVEPPASPEARRVVLSVSEFTARIRNLLESTFFEVWIEGEISNCKLWNTGHLYFTLKDPGAQVKGVMFRSALRYLRFKPEDGLRIVARGRISVYDPKGEYQIVCEHMEPQGLGALQLAFDQLKRRLEADGLFDAARKRPLPALPRKIGIVTSTDGAALRDILQVLRRRYPDAHIVIRPTRVQGEGAAGEVARGLRDIARVAGVDVIIVGRGGGSMEDLWAFNEERVARAIAASPVPVISAVGHETDVTIADYVADLRAPTPSAAAELVVARRDDFYDHIDRLAERSRAALRGRLQRWKSRTALLAGRPGLAGWTARFGLRGRHAAELTHDLRRLARAAVAQRERRYQALRLQLETYDVRRRFAAIGTRLSGSDLRLRSAVERRRDWARAMLGEAAGRLNALSPLAVLGRGYAVCWTEDRSAIVRDASVVAVGDGVHVILSRGALDCRVEQTKPEMDT